MCVCVCVCERERDIGSVCVCVCEFSGCSWIALTLHFLIVKILDLSSASIITVTNGNQERLYFLSGVLPSKIERKIGLCHLCQ